MMQHFFPATLVVNTTKVDACRTVFLAGIISFLMKSDVPIKHPHTLFMMDHELRFKAEKYAAW